jgi:hypothetical protein
VPRTVDPVHDEAIGNLAARLARASGPRRERDHGAPPRARADERSLRIARGISPRDEFNALRDRLPRSVRRDVQPVPPGHVGLIVQVITGSDCAVLTAYGHVRAGIDPAEALAALERRLRRQFG